VGAEQLVYVWSRTSASSAIGVSVVALQDPVPAFCKTRYRRFCTGVFVQRGELRSGGFRWLPPVAPDARPRGRPGPGTPRRRQLVRASSPPAEQAATCSASASRSASTPAARAEFLPPRALDADVLKTFVFGSPLNDAATPCRGGRDSGDTYSRTHGDRPVERAAAVGATPRICSERICYGPVESCEPSGLRDSSLFAERGR
jgi:hypothetical protein